MTFWGVSAAGVQAEAATHVDRAREEADDAKHSIQERVGDVDEGDVLGATGAEVGERVEHARGEEAHEADKEDLNHGGVVWTSVQLGAACRHVQRVLPMRMDAMRSPKDPRRPIVVVRGARVGGGRRWSVRRLSLPRCREA
jgi:hypothetical protein